MQDSSSFIIYRSRLKLLRVCLLCSVLTSHTLVSHADGIIIDKVYHPYVQALERELEWRSITQDNPKGEGTQQIQRFAYGQSLNDHWFAEVYLVAEQTTGQNLELSQYELELKHQLTEQGEYWADFGVLFELEKSADYNIWEFATAILIEKELGKWSHTLNIFAIQEWGDDIVDEFETSARFQSRYRYSRYVEPAIEFYSGQGTLALGPALLGQLRLPSRQLLHWEAGAILPLDKQTSSTTYRFMLEYEF